VKTAVADLQLTYLEIECDDSTLIITYDELTELYDVLVSNHENLFLELSKGSLTQLVLFNLWYRSKGSFDDDAHPTEFSFTANRREYSAQLDDGLIHVLSQGKKFERKSLNLGPDVRGVSEE
jgi:hypothetical protein